VEALLPVGPQTVTGEAFEGACPASPDALTEGPAWVSDGVFARILPHRTTQIHLAMRRRADAHVVVDFPEEGSAGAVACGGGFTCALTVEGAALCWGSNTVGQTGTSNLPWPPILLPTPVTELSLPARAIAAGGSHACTILDDAASYCWGFGEVGQVGAPLADWTERPLRVENLPEARAIALGEAHSCAITPADGVSCWGWNVHGQIGDGTFDNRYVATPVPGLAAVEALAMGYSHSCALLADGTVRCWGSNASGQLGDGSPLDSPTPTAVLDLEGVVALAAGLDHTCAALASGAVHCWGGNGHGQLGDGTLVPHDEPAPVVGLPAPALTLRAFGQGTCAVLSDDSVWCWGKNGGGRLGGGDAENLTVPTEVDGLPPAIDVSVGADHACAVGTTGILSCWGANGSGQLGDGSTTPHELPEPVAL
jgi:alpha-tubulin suppressor-like RCC1 family protein